MKRNLLLMALGFNATMLISFILQGHEPWVILVSVAFLLALVIVATISYTREAIEYRNVLVPREALAAAMAKDDDTDPGNPA